MKYWKVFSGFARGYFDPFFVLHADSDKFSSCFSSLLFH